MDMQPKTCYDKNEAAKRYQRRTASDQLDGETSEMAKEYVAHNGFVVMRKNARAASCPPCNQRKHTIDHLVFARRLGMLL